LTLIVLFILNCYMPRLAASEPAAQDAQISAHCEQPDGSADQPDARAGLMDRETLTDNWFGLGEKLADDGIKIGLFNTQVYQIPLHGFNTEHDDDRYSGSYDLELTFDMEKLTALKGGSVYVLVEGGWSDGINDPSLGSLFGPNDDTSGNEAVFISQFFYEQALLDDKVRFRIGKVDLTGGFECRGCPVSFDGNSFANDETTQFLNSALVNNPTIPFPEEGLGAIVHVEPIDWWYLSAGVADAQADARETGFNTAFHGEDYFYGIFETGVTPQLDCHNGPLQGAYRVGVWYDPQPYEQFDGGVQDDNVGFYISADQMIYRQSADEDDERGLGVFARYGLADPGANTFRHFWSAGLQYRGLIPGRQDDVTAFGVASGCFSDELSSSMNDQGLPLDTHETVFEWYYNIQVTPWLNISPDVQYILNPSGGKFNDGLVIGIRAQIAI